MIPLERGLVKHQVRVRMVTPEQPVEAAKDLTPVARFATVLRDVINPPQLIDG